MFLFKMNIMFQLTMVIVKTADSNLVVRTIYVTIFQTNTMMTDKSQPRHRRMSGLFYELELSTMLSIAATERLPLRSALKQLLIEVYST